MFRVAHLLPNLVTGGRERFVSSLCQVSRDYAVEPLVLCHDPDAPGQQIGIPGVELVPIDRTGDDFPARLLAVLAARQIDMLHCQGHASAALAAPVMRHVPTITTVHVALGTGWRWLPAIMRGLRASKAVTAVSDDLARRFRRLAGQPITLTPPGVDLAIHSRQPPLAAPRPFTIGIAARLHPIKRHKDAIAAIRLLVSSGIDCRLVLCGEGPEEAALRQASTGLPVEFHGHQEDMATWLGNLDAFLLPSDHEGTPLALMEAMACGLPCIATAVGGIPGLVGQSALLTPRRNPAAIAIAVTRLVQDAQLRRDLGRSAREQVQRYSVQRTAETFARLYSGITRVEDGPMRAA